MAVLTTRFADDIAKLATGGMGWPVTIVQHQGGNETAVLDDPHPQGRWSVARAIEKLGKHEVARRHFWMARSSFHRFLFRDPFDPEATRTGADLGMLSGAGTAWQMVKRYAASDATFRYDRTLYRIRPATERIWRNTVLQVRDTHYAIDNSTGAVTSAASWTGDTLEMSCQFDVLCRYDVDRMNAETIARGADGHLRIRWADIDIVSVPEEE